MHRSAMLLTATLALSVAACNRGEEGTQIAVTANGSGGSMGSDGQVKIDTPAFKGAFKLPQINLSAENFELNGVHLYPDSKIAAVNADGTGKDKVTVRFTSPADPATVRTWFAEQFKQAGTEVKVDGNTLTGRDDDQTFTIDLSPQGKQSAGVIRIG
ncbi:hypothetical protein SAMN05216382_1629 [Sphingomonas palmae]|uniref:Lipoprotein n=1 Tax=Sphingomonas palmae TaxID=1855283 RepID=A0A1H7NM60_9SPHN|nr:hypothetical protein [Sphingomonas palmae]SEL24409.1 hypothetical protein SAMN05216382_1629 [Sphingomonas palmae]